MPERRKFDNAFKLMTDELCLSGKLTSEVAAGLGLGPELVWVSPKIVEGWKRLGSHWIVIFVFKLFRR